MKGLLIKTNLLFIAVIFTINIELTAKETDLPSRVLKIHFSSEILHFWKRNFYGKSLVEVGQFPQQICLEFLKNSDRRTGKINE